MRLIERPDLYIYITFMTNNARLPGGGGGGRGKVAYSVSSKEKAE
jgi:hypothetical protein